MIEIKNRYTNAILQTVEADTLCHANLCHANLRHANLCHANLHDAYLTGANLIGANLHDANLGGAYLRVADLTGAYLTGADLGGADLHGADLTGAYLHDADLSGAYLRGAKGYVCLGWDNIGHHFRAIQHADGWRISACCHWFTVSEAEIHWRTKNNLDALARVAILEAHPI